VWAAQSLSSVVSANRVDVNVWMEGSVVVRAAWRETLHDRRNSNRCDSETQENIYTNKVRGRRIFTAHNLPYIKSVLGQRAFLQILEPEDGANRLSRNVGKKLPLPTA